jgi:hypothetical protein
LAGYTAEEKEGELIAEHISPRRREEHEGFRRVRCAHQLAWCATTTSTTRNSRDEGLTG